MEHEQVIDTDGQILTKVTTIQGNIFYRNSKIDYHRVGGPAIILANGIQEYWVDGEQHRIGGPAYIGSDGYQSYWVDGKRHRTDGPAVFYPDGTQEYWVDNIKYTEEQYPQAVITYKLKQLVG